MPFIFHLWGSQVQSSGTVHESTPKNFLFFRHRPQEVEEKLIHSLDMSLGIRELKVEITNW